MSFQGDVRGIGLAELLQGLARGQKEGILTLTAAGSQRAVLGIEEGKAWLLPDPDEDPSTWAVRARDAWADDPTYETTVERLEPIAKAGRLETLYELLDGGGVHFRFNPGSIGERTTVLAPTEHQKVRVHCSPTQVEFLLLEYARIADEVELANSPRLPHRANTPCITSQQDLGQMPVDLQQQCDGSSTIQEIADRLAQPLRQVQLGLLKGISGGGLRFAHPIEQLHVALQEMQRTEFSRAASRLAVWCRDGSPGPLFPADADALTNEWLAGRLISTLRTMQMRDVRTLLRRIDATLDSPSHAVVHWTEAHRISPGDRIVRLHLSAARLRDEGDACGMEPREALDLARDLRDHHSPVCSGPALAIAAHLQPALVSERLELGLGLLGAGRVPDAAPWILTACTDMLAQGHADRLLTPLRSLLDLDPRNREARELLTRARRRSTRSKKVRQQAAVAGAVLITMVTMGVTKLRASEERRVEIETIGSMLNRPGDALERLDGRFRTDLSVEVLDLRMKLEDQLRKEESLLTEEWDATFDRARREAVEGELLVALDMYRVLPDPPVLRVLSRPWRSGTEILGAITERLKAQITSLGPPTIHAPRQITVEKQVAGSIEALQDALTEDELTAPMLDGFQSELAILTEEVINRERVRSVDRLEAEHARILKENDALLALAHDALAESRFGDALNHYEQILENDPAGKVRRVLEKEVAFTRRKLDAADRARDAAARGDHIFALEILDGTFEDAERIMLPWKIKTTPPGVRVTVKRHGEDHNDQGQFVTPFALEGTFADVWTLHFELEGFDSRKMSVRGPQDLDVALSRSPAVHFDVNGGRVDAIPAPIGDGTTGEYIVCDRTGAIARMAWGGEMRWQLDINDVSGIARRPVTMPGLQGSQLFITESGCAWLLNPEEGTLRGPLELNSKPVSGPVVIGDEAKLLLGNEMVASWTSSLRPEFTPAGASSDVDDSLQHGFEGLFTVQRPTASGTSALRSTTADGTGWSIKVEDGWYRISEDDHENEPFLIRREGSWAYVAWEAPSIKGDPPVLWISDKLGLRAFLPPNTKRTITGR